MTKLTARDRGILVQVAFKAAFDGLGVDAPVPQLKGLTETYADLLIEVSDKYEGGGLDEFEQRGKRGGGGGYSRGGGGGGNRSSVSLDAQPIVEIDYFGDGDLVKFRDQRKMKQKYDGPWKDNSPDFQSLEEFDVKGDGSTRKLPIWIISKDGAVDQDSVSLLKAAGVTFLPKDLPETSGGAVRQRQRPAAVQPSEEPF